MGVEVLSVMEVRQKDRYSKILVNLVYKFFKTLKKSNFIVFKCSR